jgi:hypothetical protein
VLRAFANYVKIDRRRRLVTILDILAVIFGVLVAPLCVIGIVRPKTSVGHAARVGAGISIVLLFLITWGNTGRDPLQWLYCSVVKSAPLCQTQQTETENLRAREILAKRSASWDRLGPLFIKTDGNARTITNTVRAGKFVDIGNYTDLDESSASLAELYLANRIYFSPSFDKKMVDFISSARRMVSHPHAKLGTDVIYMSGASFIAQGDHVRNAEVAVLRELAAELGTADRR